MTSMGRSAPGRVLAGIGAAIRARPWTFLGVAALVVVLDLLLPPLVLSLTRKPMDFFTVNPWLKRLPEFLVSTQVTLARKLEFVSGMTLLSFAASSPFGAEWGFEVDVTDLARFALSGGLVGAYFALWLYRRDRLAGAGPRLGRSGGVTGALATVLGLSTGPCSVMGCGAPVIPVVGLAFVELSSGALAMLAVASRVATAGVLLALAAGVAWLGWLAGGLPDPARRAPADGAALRAGMFEISLPPPQPPSPTREGKGGAGGA
jgi:hypothetical protein